MHKILRLFLALAIAAVFIPLAAGQSNFRDEGLQRLGTLEEKVVGLAEAVPADKYTWRPMEGVRSISEVYLHIALLNYATPRAFGTPPPDGLNLRGYDKSTTDKTEIVAALKDAFAHHRKALEKVDGNAPDKMLQMRRRQATARAALMNNLEHISEHLGQSIAYARTNEVVPPWTAARQAR